MNTEWLLGFCLGSVCIMSVWNIFVACKVRELAKRRGWLRDELDDTNRHIHHLTTRANEADDRLESLGDDDVHNVRVIQRVFEKILLGTLRMESERVVKFVDKAFDEADSDIVDEDLAHQAAALEDESEDANDERAVVDSVTTGHMPVGNAPIEGTLEFTQYEGELLRRLLKDDEIITLDEPGGTSTVTVHVLEGVEPPSWLLAHAYAIAAALGIKHVKIVQK